MKKQIIECPICGHDEQGGRCYCEHLVCLCRKIKKHSKDLSDSHILKAIQMDSGTEYVLFCGGIHLQLYFDADLLETPVMIEELTTKQREIVELLGIEPKGLSIMTIPERVWEWV